MPDLTRADWDEIAGTQPPATPPVRFEVRALINGEGLVIVDTKWEFPMIGPYPRTATGRRRADQRAAEFEADPSNVPSERPRESPIQRAAGEAIRQHREWAERMSRCSDA